jgi:hypothetical protein
MAAPLYAVIAYPSMRPVVAARMICSTAVVVEGNKKSKPKAEAGRQSSLEVVSSSPLQQHASAGHRQEHVPWRYAMRAYSNCRIQQTHCCILRVSQSIPVFRQPKPTNHHRQPTQHSPEPTTRKRKKPSITGPTGSLLLDFCRHVHRPSK